MKKSELNILIIEDDKTMREALAEAVKRKGYRAIPVGKPDEAESIVKIKPVHALIVDVMLPGKNGVDLILKIRENLLDEVPIMLISGIYRDKAYAQEAVAKVGAIEYYLKPFNIEEVLSKLEKKLETLESAPKVDLYTLLSQPFASPRDRRKALDHVENLTGFDLPFVFCILMDSESSGHLNIVDQFQNIYGVTFAKGAIAKIDSESTVLTAKKILIQYGFISELELGELKAKGAQGDLVKALISEGLISPHAPGIIKMETLAKELSKIITGGAININFVPDRKIAPQPEDVDSSGFLPYLNNILDSMVPIEWLKNFYSQWQGNPITPGPQFKDSQAILGLPILRRVPDILEYVKTNATIEEALAKGGYKPDDFYKAMHFLMLRRIIVFQEGKKVQSADDFIGRLKSLHTAIAGLDPVAIFEFFGLGKNPKAADVARIYKEFAKANHPDTIPSSAPAEIKKLNHELFSRVTAAFETLTDEEKKKKYFDGLKQKEAEKQILSDDMIGVGLKHLSRGQYAEALKTFTDADNLYSSERSKLHLYWAQLKTANAPDAFHVDKIDNSIKAMPAEVRRIALWVFVNALVKKSKGDIKGFVDELNRVLQIDSNFNDARRELLAYKSSVPEAMTAEKLLTGDLSTVLKSLFKKKGA